MRQLARTLLILGSVTACERAHPDTEPTKPKPAPLVDTRGAPAVGNIGQTGAPAVGNIAPVRATEIGAMERPSRRAQRVVRAATMPRPGASGLDTGGSNPATLDPLQRPDPDVDVTRPELPPRVPPARTTRLEFQRDDSAKFSLSQERPLVNRRERPAHANMGRRASIAETDE